MHGGSIGTLSERILNGGGSCAAGSNSRCYDALSSRNYAHRGMVYGMKAMTSPEELSVSGTGYLGGTRAMPRISFPTADPPSFLSEVRTRVADYFDSRHLSPKANPAMIAKTLIVFGVTFGAYGLILSGWFTPLQMLGLCVVMGTGVAGIGFCVAHDALHDAYSSNRSVNRLLGLSFDLVGANGYMWKLTHNVIHHTYTNIQGVDDDLEVSPLLRLSPNAEWKPIHRFQHLYGFFAYSLSTMNWVFMKDYRYFLRRHLGPYRNRSHSAREIAGLIGWKIFYYGYTIVVPLIVLRLPRWQFLIGYLTMHLTAGIILGVVFQLAHVVEGTEYPIEDKDGRMGHAWAVHQMETTSDFAGRNRWLSWYVGGLNFQVEHHLFPKVCSVHYPAISEIVREVAKKYAVPYNHHPTLGAAVRSHFESLKRLGNPQWASASLAPPAEVG